MDEITLQISKGIEPVTALIDSSQSRLRPVMMASLTTILGMIPLLSDADVRSTGGSYHGGLLCSTLITSSDIIRLVLQNKKRSIYFTDIQNQEQMKKTIIIPLSRFLLWHLVAPAQAQETLSLKECREMALKYSKEMVASVKQTESAHYTAKSYKGNFFPNLTASGTGLYSNADGSYGIAGGNLPVFLPDATGQFNPGQPSGFAYFPGINP